MRFTARRALGLWAPWVAVLSLAACDDRAQEPPDLGNWLRDEDGGVLVLRGTNVSGEAKFTEDLLADYGAEDFARLRDELGFNAIRLLVFWQAIEPTEGTYDDEYLGAIQERVHAAGAEGLHVLVDMHQDVFGPGFGWDGAPRWACDEDLYAAYDPPEEWFLGYFEPEVQVCFDRLWNDEATGAAFAAAWARVAHELADEDAVLAYEILNEPQWGTGTISDFERELAPALYARVIDAIREEDPEARVAIEPSIFSITGISTELKPPDRPRLLYAPHIYPMAVEARGVYDGNADTLANLVDTVDDDATRLELPLLVTELGVRRDVEGAVSFLMDLYGALDARAVSAFQWDLGRSGDASYGLWDEAGAPALQALAIARPTPWRVAGVPLGWAWDADAREWAFEWDEDGTADGETVISFPSLAYPEGYVAQLDDGGELSDDAGVVRVPQTGGIRRLTSVVR